MSTDRAMPGADRSAADPTQAHREPHFDARGECQCLCRACYDMTGLADACLCPQCICGGDGIHAPN